MSDTYLIDDAFEDLAHGLRVLLEANWRAHQGRLLLLDRAEAVGNIENGYAAVLNAFHSLYDAMDKALSSRPINWYTNGPLATVLALRNARHHNKARKVRTLYTYHLQEAEDPQRMEQYVLVDFPSPEEGADTFDLYISWGDLENLLSLPKEESRISSASRALIEGYLGSEKFASYAGYYGLTGKRVFLNSIPLLVNAAATVVPLALSHISGRSTESETYKTMFESMELALTSAPQVECGPFALP